VTLARGEENETKGPTLIEIRETSQCPASRKSRAVKAEEKNIINHVPHSRFPRARVVKHIIWRAIVEKVTGRHQCPGAGERWAKVPPEKRHPRQIPDPLLARAGVKQCVIRVPVIIEIRHIDQIPASRQ